jgi:outer membrane protein assembly factor BamD
MLMASKLPRFLGIFVLLSMLSGCGIIDWFYLPPGEDTVQELFEAGNDAMREKDYVAASGYFVKLKDTYPFSPYAVEAELSLADCYFLDEEWLMAVDAYKDFESLHPRHQAIPYVLFNIAMANMNGYPSIDRPAEPIVEAYSYFQRLNESYPNTENA